MKCKQLIEILEQLAPPKYAESWDNVGLLSGSQNQEVKKVMIALDPSKEVIEQAIFKGVDLLITHHPLVFSPMKRVTDDDLTGKKQLMLIRNNISAYAIHTNFDVAVMAAEAAKMLNIKHTKVLDETYKEKRYKLAVYVPIDHADKVRDAMSKEGAGHIGAYSHCTYNIQGIGTYLPLEGTNPYIGSVNELVHTPEYKIETIVTENNKENVIHAMLRVHPYEEVAYDLYELCQGLHEEGLGTFGYLDQNITLFQCAKLVKEKFNIENVRVIGDMGGAVASVALCPGSGKSFIKKALKLKADVFIAGDIDYHTAIDAKEQGINIIDAGHFGTEKLMVSYVKQYLQEYLDQLAGGISNIEIISAIEEDPFTFL